MNQPPSLPVIGSTGKVHSINHRRLNAGATRAILVVQTSPCIDEARAIGMKFLDGIQRASIDDIPVMLCHAKYVGV
jgi:hypothetical protein